MSYRRPIIYKRAKYKNLYVLYVFKLTFLCCYAVEWHLSSRQGGHRLFKGPFFEVFQKASFYPECFLWAQHHFCGLRFEIQREK